MTPNPDHMRIHLNFLFGVTDPDFLDGMIEISRLTESKYFSLTQMDDAIAQAVAWNNVGHNVYVCPVLLVPDIHDRIAKREAEEKKRVRTRGEDFYGSNVVWIDKD